MIYVDLLNKDIDFSLDENYFTMHRDKLAKICIIRKIYVKKEEKFASKLLNRRDNVFSSNFRHIGLFLVCSWTISYWLEVQMYVISGAVIICSMPL